MNDVPDQTRLGWDEADEPGNWGLGSLLLLVGASGLYWTFIWLASGFPPFAAYATRLRARQEHK